MAKSSQGPKENPKHFGETLPDLSAEQGKLLPTGTGKQIAIQAAKEIGSLAADIIKSGGLITPLKLLTIAWKAVSVYRSAKAEALRRLNETYLMGRDVWAKHILDHVEGSEFNVSGDEGSKQDIRDFLHGTPPPPNSPLRIQVRTQYRKQKEYEAVIASLEALEQQAAANAEQLSTQLPSQPDISNPVESLQKAMEAGRQQLQHVAESLDSGVRSEEHVTDAAPAGTSSDTVKTNAFEGDRRQHFSGNPLTLSSWLVSGVASLALRDGALPAGLTIKAAGKPKHIVEKYANKRGYHQINGAVTHNGVKVEFFGVVVDADCWWVSDNSVRNTIRITAADGTAMDLSNTGDVRFFSQGRFYDYHSENPDASIVGGYIIKAMEALERA